MTILKTSLFNTQRASRVKALLIVPWLVAALVACGSQLTPEQEIHEYLYMNQPVTGEQFIAWADENLADYPNRRVYRALYNEGESQAKKGHPNAIVVLNQAAKAWAKDKGLHYETKHWLGLYDEAMANLAEAPHGELKLWPDDE